MSDIGAAISEPTLRRLPRYARLLRTLMQEGQSTVSSAALAEVLRLDPTLVRKDLASTGAVGRPRVGFEVVGLLDSVETFLGWRNATDAFLVGVGHLGTALLGYDGFVRHGLRIVAAFDADPGKIGTVVHGYEILPVDKLAGLAVRMRVHMGILAVPGRVAQEVAEVMVAGGILALWNFAPATLQLSPSIIVEEEQLYASLAVLARRLERRLARVDPPPGGEEG